MDTQRLILFFVFAFSLLLLWEAWQKELRPAAPASPPTQGTVPIPSTQAGTPAGKGVDALPPALAPAGKPRERVRVHTDTMLAEIDTQGGDIVYLELLKHKDTRQETQNFVLFGPEHRYSAQSGLIGEGLPNHRTLFRATARDFTLEQGRDRLEVRLQASTPEGIKVTKILTFYPASYRIDIAEEIVNATARPLETHAYFQVTRDGKPPAGDPYMAQTYTGAAFYTERDKFHKVTFEDVAKGKAPYPKSSDNGWIAVIQHYFVAALLPPDKTPREFYARKLAEDLYSVGVIVPVGPIAPGAEARVVVPLYAGPQDQDHLQSVAPGLELVVDYGWLTVIAAPLFWVLKLFHRWMGNWGVAIILLTVVIKLIFFPLSAASYRSMAKMKLVTPRLMKLREQYADDKTKMNQAMMELYKTEKINPLGGCLPILVQIPVFIALYWVLLSAVEVRNTTWIGWIKDLAGPDPNFVLPVVYAITAYLQVRLSPTPISDPVQAKVMQIMPIAFSVMFIFFPSGLVLYWLINNSLQIFQQWHMNRVIERETAAAVAK